MTETEKFDLIIVGAGSGGVRAARIAASHGAKVAICEESRVGGTCVIRGCVPKKLLMYASHFSEDFHDAESFGWTINEATFSWQKLIANKDKEIDRLNGIYHRLLDNAGSNGGSVTTVLGRGALTGTHQVTVGERVLEGQYILIGVGGRPFMPQIEGIELAIMSDDAFDLPELPKRVVIAGGGYIAVEFAGIFNGMGSEVQLAYRGDQILRGFDDDVRTELEAAITKKGIDIWHNADITALKKTATGIHVSYADGREAEADIVMYATGRVPYTWDLGLEQAGVEVDRVGAIVVDSNSQTSASHIYAVGDVTNRINLTPVALREGHAFADSVFGNMQRQADHKLVPSAVFSQPPIGSVGYTQTEAVETFGKIRVYQSRFTAMKHSLGDNPEKTYMKMLVEDATDKVVGLHVMGIDAAEMVQGFAVAVKNGLTKADFDATVGIHPTSGEELVTLRDYRIVEK